ncbi:hypothetical protein Pelo_6043 [Pelomyxa schiedti]|nr:hypothetical protein Pelo_6043 [Pelomyxa schiedti]
MDELQTQLPDPLLIVLVESGNSLSQESYSGIVTHTLPLVVHKTRGMLRSIIEFATTVKVVCPFTANDAVLTCAIKGTDEMVPNPKFPKDPTKAVKKHPGMTQMHGGANLADALTSATFAALGAMSETSKLVVLLIVSGQFTSPFSKPYQDLMALTPPPIVMAVAVGSHVTEEEFNGLFPGARIFFSGNNQKLYTLLSELQRVEQPPPIDISCSQVGTTFQTTADPVILHVSIRPTSITGTVPAGTILHFLPGFYLDEVVKTTADVDRDHPFETTVTLQPGQRALIYKGLVPDKVLYECFMEGTKYTGFVTLLLAWFGAEWLPERTRLPNPTMTRINILVWGWYGSGKSAFYNGVATSFSSEQKVLSPLLAFNMPEHVTGDYTDHPLADLLSGNSVTDKLMRKLNLHFWDPWGISENNYKKVSVMDFLNGRIESGTSMEDSFNIVVNPDKASIIHSVILLVPIGTGANPQALEILGTHVKAIIRAGRKPIVVCNFVNRVSDELEVEENYKKIRSATFLPEKCVIKFDNYVEETHRNMEKDLQYWGILRLAFTNAITYLLSHPRDCYLEGTPPSGSHPPVICPSTPPPLAEPTALETLSQVDVIDANNPSLVSNLWEIDSNTKLTAVRKEVEATGEFTSISPWIFIDDAGKQVSVAKESDLTLKQILRTGHIPSIRIQKYTKVVTTEPTLGIYLTTPKSTQVPDYLYDLLVPENFLEKSVAWLDEQLADYDILAKSKAARVAPSARGRVPLKNVIDTLDGKQVVYVTERP